MTSTSAASTSATSGSSATPASGAPGVPNAAWYGLVSCLDITGLTLLNVSRRVPDQRRATWLRQITVTQHVVLAWVIGWAVTVAVVLGHDGSGLALYAPVGLLMTPIAAVVVGVWTPILRVTVARFRGPRNERRPA